MPEKIWATRMAPKKEDMQAGYAVVSDAKTPEDVRASMSSPEVEPDWRSSTIEPKGKKSAVYVERKLTTDRACQC